MERRRTRRVVALTGAVAALVVGLLGVLPQAVPQAQAAVGVDPYHATFPDLAASATGPVALSPDGGLLAVAEGDTVEVISTRTERPILAPVPVSGTVGALDFASGTSLVVGTDASVDFLGWTTTDQVSTPTRPVSVPIAGTGSADSVVAASDKLAYVLKDGAIWAVDRNVVAPAVPTATKLVLDQPRYQAIAYAAGELYAISGVTLEELDPDAAAPVKDRLTLNATATSLAMAPDGQHLFIGEAGQLAQLSLPKPWAQPATVTLPSPTGSAYPPPPAAPWTNLPAIVHNAATDTTSCDVMTVSADGSTVYCTGHDAHLYWFTMNAGRLGFAGAYDAMGALLPAPAGTPALAVTPGTSVTGPRVYAARADHTLVSIPVDPILAGVAVPNGSRPSAPRNVVVASDASTTVNVSWSAPIADGGQRILGYLVTATPAGGGASYCTPGATGTACTITGLTKGSTYTISVQAANILGPGSESDPQTITLGIPTAPRNVSVGTPALSGAKTSLSVTWTAPASSGDSPIDGYLVCADAVVTTGTQPTCGVTLPLGHTCPASAAIACPSASGTGATLTGLDPKTTYLVTVTAYNDTAAGTTSTPVSIVTGAPGAPTGLTSRVLNQTITLSWHAPSYTGIVTSTTSTGTTVRSNAAATYTAFLEPGHIPCQGSAAAPMSPTTCTWTGLTNGVTYSASVIAWAGANTSSSGSAGLASPAATLTGLLPSTTPDAPTVTALVTAPGQVTVTWIAPAEDGGTPITGYTASARSGGTAHTCTTTTTLSCTITGLTNAVSYGVTVTATNAQGDGTPSTGQVVTPSGPPSVVRAVRVAVSGTRASVEWAAPAATGSGAGIGYLVTATSAHDRRQCQSQGATGCDLVGLRAGETYAISVVATNAGGFSSGASAAVRATALATPAAPAATVHKRRKHRADVTVRWTALVGATGYQLARTGGPLLAVKRSTSGTSLTFAKLPKGRYRFTVTALGLGGHSGTSAVRTVRVR